MSSSSYYYTSPQTYILRFMSCFPHFQVSLYILAISIQYLLVIVALIVFVV